MSNFDALKQIYEALGGDEEITGTNLEALKAIAEVAGSGGGGGGGGVLAVTITLDEDAGIATADKTFAEISAAVAAGEVVIAKMAFDDEGVTDVYHLVTCTGDGTGEADQAYFLGSVSASGSGVYVNAVRILPDGTAVESGGQFEPH